jgi:hypothetical protein
VEVDSLEAQAGPGRFAPRMLHFFTKNDCVIGRYDYDLA